MDGIEPIDDGPSPCRQAALAYSRVIFAVDEFMATATDARLNWVATSIALLRPTLCCETGSYRSMSSLICEVEESPQY